MRWSIAELIYAWKIHSPFTFKQFFTKLPIRWFRRIRLIFFWLFRGYTYEVTWDLDNYFIRVIIDRLKIFKRLRQYGHPANLESEEEWDAIIDKLIKGFEIMESEEYSNDYPAAKIPPTIEPVEFGGFKGWSLKSNWSEDELELFRAAMKKQELSDKETLELFIKYFRNLWD